MLFVVFCCVLRLFCNCLLLFATFGCFFAAFRCFVAAFRCLFAAFCMPFVVFLLLLLLFDVCLLHFAAFLLVFEQKSADFIGGERKTDKPKNPNGSERMADGWRTVIVGFRAEIGGFHRGERKKR